MHLFFGFDLLEAVKEPVTDALALVFKPKKTIPWPFKIQKKQIVCVKDKSRYLANDFFSLCIQIIVTHLTNDPRKHLKIQTCRMGFNTPIFFLTKTPFTIPRRDLLFEIIMREFRKGGFGKTKKTPLINLRLTKYYSEKKKHPIKLPLKYIYWFFTHLSRK